MSDGMIIFFLLIVGASLHTYVTVLRAEVEMRPWHQVGLAAFGLVFTTVGLPVSLLIVAIRWARTGRWDWE